MGSRNAFVVRQANRRRPAALLSALPDTTEEGHMLSENNLDLEIALQKLHELALADGDLGYAYWYEIGQLLRRAAGMQAEIDSLKKELERCRAVRGHEPS